MQKEDCLFVRLDNAELFSFSWEDNALLSRKKKKSEVLFRVSIQREKNLENLPTLERLDLGMF